MHGPIFDVKSLQAGWPCESQPAEQSGGHHEILDRRRNRTGQTAIFDGQIRKANRAQAIPHPRIRDRAHVSDWREPPGPAFP